MSILAPASYWSATAGVGREWRPPRKETGTPASYWSATADVGVGDRVSLSRAVIDSTFYNRRNIPPVVNRGEAGSAYRAQQLIADIEREKPAPGAILEKLRKGDDRSLDGQESFFMSLKDRLIALSEKVKTLELEEAFNPYGVKSSHPGIVGAEPSIHAEENSYSVTVERLAVAHQVASDESADTHAALGLSGSFRVNGYTVAVEAGDSLADIRDKINNGEDSNGDGAVTTQNEDLNGNGELDVYYQPGVYAGGRWLPGFYYNEDVNGNGVLDTAEDVDGDEFLTGGSENIKAEARLEDDRLVIKSLEGADKRLRIEDQDGILESLGFYKTDDYGEKHLKTAIDSDYHEDPVTAKLTVDGERLESAGNIVGDAISGVALSLKKTTSRAVTITVYRDPSAAAANVVSFASAYNDAISLINYENIGRSPIQENVRAQDLAMDLALAANGRVESIPSPPRSLKDLGLFPAGSVPRGVDIATLKTIKEGLDKPKDHPRPLRDEPGVMARLDRLGITSAEDFTLDVDLARLKKSLTENPAAARDVFNKAPDGVLKRLEKTLGRALDENKGMIAFQRKLIEYYRKSEGEVNDLLSRRMERTRYDVKRTSFENILGPITA
ncbi:MAG: flagellar filament capping protein FliD [Candidatus Nitrospinota bacterium M3_3B_026]